MKTVFASSFLSHVVTDSEPEILWDESVRVEGPKKEKRNHFAKKEEEGSYSFSSSEDMSCAENMSLNSDSLLSFL